MYNIVIGRGKQFVHCREAVHSSECALSGCPHFRVCIIGLSTLQSVHPAVHCLECASGCPLFRVCIIELSTIQSVHWAVHSLECALSGCPLFSVHYRAWRFRCRSVHAGELRCRGCNNSAPFVYTVESLYSGPPKSGQTFYKGHHAWNGMSSIYTTII